jgi:hypothetical protein
MYCRTSSAYIGDLPLSSPSGGPISFRGKILKGEDKRGNTLKEKLKHRKVKEKI